MKMIFNRRGRREGAKGAKGLHVIKIVNSSPSSDNQQIFTIDLKVKIYF